MFHAFVNQAILNQINFVKVYMNYRQRVNILAQIVSLKNYVYHVNHQNYGSIIRKIKVVHVKQATIMKATAEIAYVL